MTNTLDLRGLDTPAHPDQPTKGQLALNGARLALAQLAVDVETLINTWEERERLLSAASLSPSARAKFDPPREEIARCRRELQGLLKLWEPK